MRKRKWIAISFWVFSITLFVYLAQFAWVLRDGLAPGFISSRGLLAWQRFAEGLLVPFILSLTLSGLGFAMFPWRKDVTKEALGYTMSDEIESEEHVWPPPISGRLFPVQHRETLLRGFLFGCFSLALAWIALWTQWIAMWIALYGLCFLLVVGVAFSIWDIQESRKHSDSKGILFGSIGIMINLMPIVTFAVVGYLD